MKDCSRCRKRKDWEHVIICDGINNMKNEYLKELKETLKEEKIMVEEDQYVKMIIDDTKRYLFSENTEYITAQHIIGMKLLFRG